MVENNYGNSSPKSTLGTKTTKPGFARVDFDPQTKKSWVVWSNKTIAVPSVVSQLSTTDGLIYTYAKSKDGWFWAALDYRTGKVVSKSEVVPWSRVLGGLPANNYYSGLTVGPDGTAYVSVFGGIVTWRVLEKGEAR